MANNKKGFVLYADQKELFDQLSDEKAGQLIKHIFAYVNDDNPVSDDLFLNLAFTPIKQQLKRDLQKWEKTINGRSKAGKASAEARANKKKQEATNSTNVKFVQQKSTKLNKAQQSSTNPTVTVNVNVNVKDKVKEIVFNKWLNYRKEIKKPITNKSTIESLVNKFDSSSLSKCEWVVNQSIQNNYTGLFWDNYKESNNHSKSNYANPII
jgi:hypothetical protein